MGARKFLIQVFIASLALVGGGARPLYAGEVLTPFKPGSFSELQSYLRDRKPDVDQFRPRGPFGVEVQENYAIPVTTEPSDSDLAASGFQFPQKTPRYPSAQKLAPDHIDTDLFLSGHSEMAPLVIFMHGYEGSRVTHFEQARHVASWGMHSLTLRLLNDSEWGTNGRTVSRLVRFLARPPGIMAGRIDVNKIILVGYSFGGISVAVALALGAPVAGAILLDPAAIGQAMPDWLPRINVPVLVIGADQRVAQANNRGYYYRNIRVAAEVSVTGASHEDAQSSDAAGLTKEELQTTFTSAITSAAFSLSSTGTLDYAWASFEDALNGGRLFRARRK
jgi:pimeloyl-ACP methyl ester carboxylesterase